MNDVDNELKKKYNVKSTAFLVNDNVFAILVGEDFKAGSYRVTGFEKGKIGVSGKKFLVIAVETAEKLDPVKIAFERLEDDIELFVGREIIVYAYLREYPFLVGTNYFGASIYPGSLTKDEEDLPLMDELKDLLESDKVDYDELPTLRLSVSQDRYENDQAFWKGVFATVNGLVVPTSFAYEIVPDQVKKYISEEEYTVIILFVEIDVKETAIEDIRANPEVYYGKVAEIEATGIGKTQSARELLSSVFPPAAISPIDVYVVIYALFNLPVNENRILPAFGISSYERALDMENPDGYYRIKGKIVSLKQLDDSLPDLPALIIFEAERTKIESISITDDEKATLQRYTDLVVVYVLGEDYKEKKEWSEHPTATPEEFETPEVKLTPKETLTPEVRPLQSLTVEISPSSITVNPRDTIKLKLKVDWKPKDWRGEADVKIILSAAGFKKEFELSDVILENPPIEEEFNYTLPSDLLPLTYEAKMVVEAGGLKAEDGVEIKVGTSKTPGFEAVVGAVALIGGLVLRRVRN